MKFDKIAVQGELDSAAAELEKAGHKDLAEKIDYYNSRIANAQAEEIHLIARALRRIQLEAKNRLAKSEPQARATKAQAAVTRARRSSVARKAVLRRRLKTIAANRKKALRQLSALTKARKRRVAARRTKK